MLHAAPAPRPRRPRRTPLGELAQELGLRPSTCLDNLGITGVSARAQRVEPGDLFVALPGAAAHGAAFSDAAAERGAVAVLTDERGAVLAATARLPVLVADDARLLLGAVAARIHRTGDPGLLLLGVTGTNGKTTTVHVIAHLLERLGVPAGVSSTAERGAGSERGAAAELTTPEPDELHALLARMREQGVRAAALEVSAQALVRSRVEGIVLDVAGFTNLTHDHLDDFGTMEAYLQAKASLFRHERCRRAVVCVDSAAGRRIAAEADVPVLTFTSRAEVAADWRVVDVRAHADSTAFDLLGPREQRVHAAIDMPGAHQAVDAALAVLMVLAAGQPLERIAAVLRDGGLTPGLQGRLERVPGSSDPAVYLDVAHTPDAFAKGLEALRPRTAGRLVVVFGADGDRDPSKREPLGRTAATLADVVVVHDHHSRFEDPDRIRAAVLRGAARGAAEVHEVRDPADAVRVAIDAAGPGGTVLWAGTGRTDYRDIGGAQRPYSFWAEAQAAVAEHATSTVESAPG